MATKLTVRELDRAVAARVVADALAAGCTVSVNDGEEWTLQRSADRDAILAAMHTTDEDYLAFWRDGQRLGMVYLVYGNGGWDVIADHSDNRAVAELLAGAFALAESFEREQS